MEPCRIQAKRLLSLGGYRLGRILQEFFARLAPAVDTKVGLGAREISAWVINGLICAVIIVYVVFEVLDAKKRKTGCELLGAEEAGP
jgi:hypothetical protein